MVLSRLRKNHVASCKQHSRLLRSKMMIRARFVLSRKTLIIRLEMTLPPHSCSLQGDGIVRVGREQRLPLMNRQSSDEEAEGPLGESLGEDPEKDPGSGSLEMFRVRQGRKVGDPSFSLSSGLP